METLVGGAIPLNEATDIPDGIKAHVVRARRGENELGSVPDAALDDDDAATERCRRLFIGWAREVGIDRVRWAMKVSGQIEGDVEAFAANEASDLGRMMALIRHKHRDESDWNPGTSDEFAANVLLRQIRDASMNYRTRGIFGSSWKPYANLSAAAQGKFEGHVMRVITISQVRRSLQVAKFTKAFDHRPLPTTKEEADQLMADMISEVLGRRVDAPKPGNGSPDVPEQSADRDTSQSDGASYMANLLRPLSMRRPPLVAR